MALSFHGAAESPPDPERTAYITTSVLDHLEAVERDLESLAGGPREPDRHPGGGDAAREGRR